MSEYNGWTNRATWNLNLWAINDPNTAARILEQGPYTPGKAARVGFGLFPDGTPDMDGPEGMDGIDWAEIARVWTAEYRDQ